LRRRDGPKKHLAEVGLAQHALQRRNKRPRERRLALDVEAAEGDVKELDALDALGGVDGGLEGGEAFVEGG
jgi:hypothetical protein